MPLQQAGPLQFSIRVGQNRHDGTQKSHWDKTNKGNYRLKLCMPFIGPFIGPVASQHGGFVPRE